MQNRKYIWVLAAALVLSQGLLGFLLGNAALRYRSLERTVQVKGLAEGDYPADTVIQPIPISAAGNEAAALYGQLDKSSSRVKAFLLEGGVTEDEISLSTPNVIDKAAREYGGLVEGARFTGKITVTVYTTNVGNLTKVMSKISALGKEGIVLQLGDYEGVPEYIFSKLNEIKPKMIEEAAINAREAAQKFAFDSRSRLGKIKTASQGQFSISPRDKNTPQIKTVRVVSTVEYYLVD